MARAHASEPVNLRVATPMEPPSWALLERELLGANARACEEFFDRYFDDRGLPRMRRALGRRRRARRRHREPHRLADPPRAGGPDTILRLYEKAWEGHLRQYTLARTKDVEFARDGMYYKEFPVMFDWMHNGEGLTVFNLQGLSDPGDPSFRRRVARYAGFYMNEDPGAPNYDPAPQDHPEPLQRQPGPAAPQGDRPSTGPATRSRSRTGSGPATARTAIG